MSTRTCIVRSCTMKGTHRIPEDETRRDLWLQAIPLKSWLKIGKHSRICSAHFSPTDFARTPLSLLQSDISPKTLKKTAIPSIFVKKTDFASEHLKTPCLRVTEVKNTYARTPPVQFVEEPSYYVSYGIEDFNEDPLQLFNDVEDPCAQKSYELGDQFAHTSHNLDDSCFQTSIDPEILACQSDNDTDDMIAEEVEILTQGDNIFHHKEIGIEQSVQTEDIQHVCKYSINVYKCNDKAIHFYTGLETFKKLVYVMNTLGPSAYKLNYFYGPPPKQLDTLDCFFITLLILRRHKAFEEIAMDYQITKKQVSNIFITWVRFMSLQWNNLDLWINKDLIKAYMPSDFHDKYPSTRVILDATEFPIKKPKLPLAQQVTFSSYKNRNTVKALIGISPSGLITYVSPCYGGSASDRQIIERSSIIDRFNYNDEIMVDKGLNVQDIFLCYGVKVNMPSFFKKGNQITPQTLTANRKVASKRVHIERVIGMLKTYKILTQPMNQTETILSSDIVYICAMLVNFRTCIVSNNA